MNKIILASASPRRKQLMELANIDFETILPKIDEDFPAEMPVYQVAEWIAKNKAHNVQSQIKDNGYAYTIIAADTVVILDEKILGKPNDEAEAKRMLASLSRRAHEVVTGVCILKNQSISSFSECTRVLFHSLSKAQIQYYIKHYKPFDKAGAYGIQEWIGAVGIKAIEGDFYNVMGLPISRICRELKI